MTQPSDAQKAERLADIYARKRHHGFPATTDNILLMETREHWLAGFHARDEEFAAMVGALEWYATWTGKAYYENTPGGKLVVSNLGEKAREALAKLDNLRKRERG